MPWLLWAVQGAGDIRIDDRTFSVGHPALDAYLKAPSTPIKSAEAVSNTAGLRLVFLINAMWYEVLSRNEVSIHGQDVWAVTIGARTVSEEITTGIFPDTLRRPTDVVIQ